MIELRTFVFVDSLQLQLASFLATVSKGYLPVAGQASLFIEIAPGIDINRLTDVALKSTGVRPGIQIVERAFGFLEVHSDDKGEVIAAGEAILESAGLKESDRLKPKVLTSQLIKNIDDYQAQLINRVRHGNMVLKGDTLFFIETDPAGYTFYIANEAEKACHLNIVEVVGHGRFGRIYISGDEAEIVVAQEAAQKAVEAITGREIK